MINFLNKNVNEPVIKFIRENPELSIGAGALGLGTYAYLYYRQKQASKRVVDVWNKYKAKYKDVNRSNIEKIRRASKLGLKADYVKPEDMERVVGTKDNAFFMPKESVVLLGEDKGFKQDKKTDPKFGHIYYTDSTKALPVIAHEYGHGESAHKGTAPTIWGNLGRSLLASAAGFGAYNGLRYAGLGTVPSTLAGALASVAGKYLMDKYTVDEEEIASANARRYLKALKHSKTRFKDDEETLDAALDTYKEAQRGSLVKGLISPVVSLGLIGGVAALLDKHGQPMGGSIQDNLSL